MLHVGNILIVDKINNNWIDAIYRQMAVRLTRWRCSHTLFGNLWSNESDTNVEDFDCTMNLFLLLNKNPVENIGNSKIILTLVPES